MLSNQKSTIISNQRETIQALKIQVRSLTKEMIEMENTIKSKVECIQKLVGIIAQERFFIFGDGLVTDVGDRHFIKESATL